MKLLLIFSALFIAIECKTINKVYRGREFVFDNRTLSRDDAIKFCSKKSMEVPILYSSDELEFVQSVLKREFQNSYFFIGTKCGPNGEFVWNDGRPIEFGSWETYLRCNESHQMGMDNDYYYTLRVDEELYVFCATDLHNESVSQASLAIALEPLERSAAENVHDILLIIDGRFDSIRKSLHEVSMKQLTEGVRLKFIEESIEKVKERVDDRFQSLWNSMEEKAKSMETTIKLMREDNESSSATTHALLGTILFLCIGMIIAGVAFYIRWRKEN